MIAELSPEDDARLDAALQYVHAGWCLLPLRGKEPAHDLLPKDAQGNARTHLLLDTPADADTIRRWFRTDPKVNIGALFGGASPLIVDLDPNKRDDDGAWRWPEDRRRVLSDCEGFEPTPLRVRSGSGGWHLYYRAPPPPARVVSAKGHRKGDGVDVLSARGRAYVVLPPSVHPDTGDLYRWIGADGSEISIDAAIDLSASLPRWPDWVVHAEVDTRPDAVAEHGTTGRWLTDTLSTPLPEGGTGEGTGRNTTLRKLALYFASRGVPADVVRQILWTWNQTYCRPPLKSDEVTRQVYVMFRRFAEDEAREAAARGEPTDTVVLRQVGPPFPLHLLAHVPALAAWVTGVHHERGVSQDLAATGAIASLAFAAVGKYRIRWMHGRSDDAPPDSAPWTFYASGWHTTIAPSGARKSIVCNVAMDALTPATDTLEVIARKYNTALAIRRETLHAARKRVQAEIDRASAAPVLRIYQEHQARIARMIAELGDDLPVSWISSDTTPEALLRKLATTGSVGLYSPECDELFSRMLGHYSGNADLNGILKSWGGEAIDVDRITRDPLKIRGGTTSIFAFGQHSVLYGLDAAGDAKDRGFHARMLYAIPDATVSDPSTDPAVLAAAAAAARVFEGRLRAIFWGGVECANWVSQYARTCQFRPVPIVEDGADDVPEIEDDDAPRGRGRPRRPFVPPPAERLEPPAVRPQVDVLIRGEVLSLFETFGARMRVAGEIGGDDWAIADWLAKAHEHAARLAVLLQLAADPPRASEPGTATTPPAVDPIELRMEFAEAAIELVESYYLPHQRVARDVMARPKETEACIHALRRFATESGDHFTLQDLAKATGVPTQTAKTLARWMHEIGVVICDDSGRNWRLTPLPGVVF